MRDGDALILKGPEISTLLNGQDRELIRAVAKAYEAHGRGESSLPHSNFLRFPGESRNRIIALPAYLGGEFKGAGIKWISSFPDNLEKGIDRASAVVILNSLETGRPQAIMEGSIISAKRTAASAALAAQTLHIGDGPPRLGLFGCGLINFEIARFIKVVFPEITSLWALDLDEARAKRFRNKCIEVLGDVDVEIARDSITLLSNCPLISFATTAIRPHVDDLSLCRPGTTILHISLRDLTPEVILSCDNVVDDIDHVCRAETSVHLAEQLTHNREFIRCALPDVLNGIARPRESRLKTTVFSPFGLGVLDLAVARVVYRLGIERGIGIVIDSFFPDPWA